MVKFYRKWFTLSDAWISENERYSDFYASSWQAGDSPVPLLAARVVLGSIAVAILTWSLCEGANIYWATFLTNWGLILVTTMMLNGIFVSVMAVKKDFPEGTGGELPWYITTYWFFFNIGVILAFTITALYWILLFDPEAINESKRLFFLDIATHGLNSCVALAELLISRTPIRLAHVYQPLGVGLWYVAFTAIYFAAGGTDGLGNPFIYEILDWRHGRRSAMVVGLAMLGLIVIYSVVWGIALLRDKLSTLLLRSSSVTLPYTPPDAHTPEYP